MDSEQQWSLNSIGQSCSDVERRRYIVTIGVVKACASGFKDLIKDKFDARVDYDKDNDRHPVLAAQLIARSKLQPGWNVLDLACGTGLVTYLAATQVGSSGFVTGMDLSPGLLQQAIFYFDMHTTAKKLRAWLKPGGLLAYNTLEAPFTPLLTMLHELLHELDHKDAQLPFSQIPDDATNEKILQEAAFKNIKVEKTPGLLLEKPTTLDTYVEKGWQLVATGFRPFFPSLASISEADLSSLEGKFKTKAAIIGKAMMNKDGMIEDKHVNLWVTAIADC